MALSWPIRSICAGAAGTAAMTVAYAGMPGAGAGLGAWFGHLARGVSRGEAKAIGAMLGPGTTALVVVGIDQDAEAIVRAAERAKEHTLKREFGEDDAEQHTVA